MRIDSMNSRSQGPSAQAAIQAIQKPKHSSSQYPEVIEITINVQYMCYVQTMYKEYWIVRFWGHGSSSSVPWH